MGQSKSIENLFSVINEYNKSQNKTKKLNEIKGKAKKVFTEHKTLNLAYDSISSFAVSPLQAAIDSLDVFKLLIDEGANPFFNPKPDLGSPIDILASKYFSSYCNVEEKATFEWLMTAEDSPLLTWNKLAEHSRLVQAFIIADLIPDQLQMNVLPIHRAIQAGRIDLVQEVIKAAGSTQAAGDINRMSILSSAIHAVFLGQENAMEIFQYLLQQGASTQKSNEGKLPLIMQALTAQVFFLSNEQDKLASILVELLLNYGATLEVINPKNGKNPLMTAMSMGYYSLFISFLEKADAATLNHRAISKPYYLLFQLFDVYENRLVGLDILELLLELKNKGLEFDKTIDYSAPSDPFGHRSYEKRRETFASNMSLLHFYVDNLTHDRDDFFPLLDKRLQVIQALIANGVDFNVKASFTSTKEDGMNGAYETKKIKISRELTAAEYLRQIADEIIGHDSDAYLIKAYRDENEFLQHIEYRSRGGQIKLHKQFHQFRNLERVLSGEKPLVYSGLPDVKKIEQLALKHHDSQEVHAPDIDPNIAKTGLLHARSIEDHDKWDMLKKSIVDYVKNAESLPDFLERVEEFKTPLQLHFDVNTDVNGEVVSYGSLSYRFLHYFDSYKFPGSWESLRAFGKKIYGIDINTQYAQPAEPTFK